MYCDLKGTQLNNLTSHMGLLSDSAHLLVLLKNALNINTLSDFCNIKLCWSVFLYSSVLYFVASFINLLCIL